MFVGGIVWPATDSTWFGSRLQEIRYEWDSERPLRMLTKGAAWRIEHERPGDLATLIPGPILAGAARCMVAANRLIALDTAMLASNAAAPGGADGYSAMRNGHVLFLLNCGTLRELANALVGLRVAGFSRWANPDALRACWSDLDALRRDIRRNAMLATVRNSVAFHLDQKDEYLTAGMMAVLARTTAVGIAAGDDESNGALFLQLGDEALMTGLLPWLDDSPERFCEFVSFVYDVRQRAGRLIQALALEILPTTTRFEVRPSTDTRTDVA